ncbi:MAG: hypothetical protein ACT4QB_22405 [Gammaproteobacteria bacterium]
MVQPAPAGRRVHYERRRPEDTVLYQLAQEHLETFLACTVALVRKLAREFDDAQIARILNKQGRRSGLGNPFTQQSVTSLRGKHRISKCGKKIARDTLEGPFTADEAARELGVTMSTVHRWLREGVPASS